MDTRTTPLTLVRLPNGQLAAVPTSVFGGSQLTLAAPPPPPQQPILQSHGTTLVLRYPQQQQPQQKVGEQNYDPNQASVMDPSTGSTAAGGSGGIAHVNGNYQFQQTQQYQQQV